MNCQSCNADIPQGGKFCPECGTVTSVTLSCSHCGEGNPANSSFCAGCGKSLKKVIIDNNDSDNNNSDFIYFLSEEKLRSVAASNVRIPYGCFAVTLVNGVINSIQDQKRSVNDEPSAISSFFKSLSEVARGLVGQKNNDVKTFIISDIKGLPLISYVHPLKEFNLKFDFWLDNDSSPSNANAAIDSIGLFFQRSMPGKIRLGSAEFRQIALDSVASFIKAHTSQNFESQQELDSIMDMLKKTTGISGRCSLVKKKSVERRFLEISKYQKPIECNSCNESYFTKIKFCESCGNNMESADWAGGLQILQSSSAESIIFNISFLSDKENDYYSDDELTKLIISTLIPAVRKFDLPSLSDSKTLLELSTLLNKTLSQNFNGVFSDFSVIDIKTAGQEWLFKTEALIAEELQKIDGQQRGLAVDERALDFNEAAFALAMRTASQRDEHRKLELQLRSQTVEIELDEHRLETQTALRREGIDHEVEGARLDLTKNKLQRDREFQREVTRENRVDHIEETRNNRVDEIDQALHEIKLEKTVAQHDIELTDMTGEAQSRAKLRDVADSVYEEEEKIRLKAAERAQLGNIEEDLQDRQNQRQVDKLKAMAELEATMAKQDQDFELAKVDGMKSMDASQILAMQAAQLVKAGGNAAAADIVKSISQSQADAAGTSIKDDLYKQLLQAKDDAAKLALEAQKTAMDALLKNNESMSKLAGAASSSSVEGYKEAAKIAQTTNEKSMDSMAKVAVASAGKKQIKEESDSLTIIDCKNPECDFVFEGKVKKFCLKCGANQL